VKAQLLRTALVTTWLGATLGAVDAGSITGEVKFIGPPPTFAPVTVSKDQDYCGETLPNETYQEVTVSESGDVRANFEFTKKVMN
jgi:hypothetical protein